MDKFKIGYFADGPWSHMAFNKIIMNTELKIEFICVRNDTNDDTLKNYCNKYNIDYLKHKNINSIEFINIIEKFNCDLFVSLSFNQIFKSNIINLPKLGTINCHAGKLPFYRGRNILNWVLINDEKEFGITVHYMVEGFDTGDIILQKVFPITDDDDYSTLLEKAYVGCASILYSAIKKVKDSQVNRVPQNSIHPTGFYCSGRKVGDEILNWNQSSRCVFNFVRAICKPGPQARTFNGKEEVFINKVEEIEDAPTFIGLTGAVLFTDEKSFIVKTKDSYVRVVDWSSNAIVKIGDRLT